MTSPSITLSDQPSRTPTVLRLFRDRRRLAQHRANTEVARTWLLTTQAALEEMVTTLETALRLLKQLSADDDLRSALLMVSADLHRQLNSHVEERLLFAGTADGQWAYDHAGRWRGSTTPVAIQVTDEVQLHVSIDAPAVFHYPPRPTGRRRQSVLEILRSAVDSEQPLDRSALVTVVESTRERCVAQIPRLNGRLRQVDDLVDSLAEAQVALDRHWTATTAPESDSGIEHLATRVSVDSALLAGERALEDILDTVAGRAGPEDDAQF